MTNTLFTASVSAVGGREGRIVSSDRVLELDVAMPGTPRAKKVEKATNPEQLFAAGYAACFDSALQLVARKERLKIETEVTANVSLLKDEEDQGFKLGVTLQVKGMGIAKSDLETLVQKAHGVCPYSKATSGNIDVTLIVAE
ncbi:organic hydroperoxide resistance protein [Bacillus atrophaeus]|jgi:Ohr subfamily peroxiredoxin|uniref:organic hydroperoxide resistance protein n=1 Tax=Bacillus atrophaeus TaxID=1452 RepID=UPI00077A8928|nr:organic hydroperoxide resistance protein [Bacillus atrophaeus]KXZ14171.1 Organic hydroperoxide resistance protein OhrA [Bacillus atrophaeus]MCY8464814.1 organic hydroperoxide resistance protein [Bacillus atrophaeus]MCY8476267.1 organic hydroperoxide resistance protein [Bacillus atrophaeus]MCY8485894.1 organic hydroperoxide resistance protein [Bacillus atrophaeus]MCY8495964.1 organic hydroperoxide resistance protein [Bacillus atrophaeus]